MNRTVREWIDKADGDYRVAKREAAIVDGPNYDAVCYHAQQCIEKLMKALLIQLGVTPPKTHNLLELQSLLRPVSSEWQASEDDVDFLNRGGIAFRYPGETAEVSDAEDAIRICGELRERILIILGSA